jgi:hypothetical protein
LNLTLRVPIVKNNLTQLRKLVREFLKAEVSKGPRNKYEILDDIIFFGNTRVTVDAIDKTTENIQQVAARATALPLEQIIYQVGTDFFRVRKLESEIVNPEDSDFWEPPPQHARPGRLNARQEPLLYLSTEVKTALLETDTHPDTPHFVIVYKARREITVTQIELKAISQSVIERERAAFVNGLFSRPGSSAHDLSRFIARRYADWSPNGWRYASTKTSGGNNICLWSSLREALFVSVAIQIKNGIPIALHYVDAHSSVSSVRDEHEIRTTMEAFGTEYTRPAGEGVLTQGISFTTKVLPRLKKI